MILRGFFYIIILPSIMLKSAHVLKFSLLHHPHRDYHMQMYVQKEVLYLPSIPHA